MEHTTIEMKPQAEQQPPEEPTAPRPWVTPAFERVPLNEALGGAGTASDGFWYS